WYGIDAFFLDQVSGAPDQVGHYADLARRARALGARLVAFNHGTHPAPAYADHADLLGTFEGPWRSYVDLAVPDWVRSWSPERFFHLVYSVPLARHWDAYALAARRGAGCAFVTDHGGANPWDYLPEGLFDALRHSGQHRSTARQNGLSRLHPQ
ncbi:MAG: hypothetical protein J2P15_14740, partial [Micromonosporaceae bacterium]|nr:hypothetical protein [Micromonosporaceae bacterium]